MQTIQIIRNADGHIVRTIDISGKSEAEVDELVAEFEKTLDSNAYDVVEAEVNA